MSTWPVPSTVNGSCGRMCSVSIPWKVSCSSRMKASVWPPVVGLSRVMSAVQNPVRFGPGWKLPPEK